MATTKKQRKISGAHMLARQCAELMLSKKGKDVVILDISEITDMTDFFVICSSDSDIQLKAIADAVHDGMAEIGSKPYRTEGWQGGQWIILDFVEVVVHVFYREAREFYKIERLWADAKVEKITDDPAPAAAVVGG